MTFSTWRFHILSTLVTAIISIGCSASSEPSVPTLIGRWEAQPGPALYATATLSIDSVVSGPLRGTLVLGSAVAGINADVRESASGLSDFDHIVLDIVGLSEFSAAKENCDGDQIIDPAQPLCGFYGKTTFIGALRNGELVGSFGLSSCEGYGSVQPCTPINLPGDLVFVRQ